MHRWMGRGLLALALLTGAGAAAASDQCPLPAGTDQAAAGLTRTREALATRRPVKVVALGSSSTEGAGASGPAATYPAQLKEMLSRAYVPAPVEVVNRGKGGETAAANLARFDRDVLAEKPDLLIWQVGTNDSVQRVPLAAFAATVRDGVARARRAGADLILMNPQSFPGETRVGSYRAYVDAVRDLGRELNVPVLDRYGIMKWWLDSGTFTADTILSSDGFHMRDPSYRCVAEFLAEMIATPVPEERRTTAAR